MDGSEEGQPQKQEEIGQANLSENLSRRQFLKGIIRGAGAAAAGTVINKVNVIDQVAETIPEGQSTARDDEVQDREIDQNLEQLPAGLGIAALATKKAGGGHGNPQQPRNKRGMFEKKYSRAQAIVGGARTVTGLGMAVAGGGSLVNLAMNTHIGEELESSAPSEVTTPAAQESKDEISKNIESSQVFDEIFPNCTPEQAKALRVGIETYKTNTTKGGIGTLEEIESMRKLLSTEKKLPNGKVITVEQVFRESALKYKININIGKGVSFIESHGKPDAVAHDPNDPDDPAIGPCQFKKAAGIRYGLIDLDENGEILKDRRKNSFEAIPAMFAYLSDLRSWFHGDIGKAVWGYHAGEGNGQHAERNYILSHTNPPVDVGIYRFADNEEERKNIIIATNREMSKLKCNVFQLHNDPKVQEFTETLKDDSPNYAIKAAAAAEYFEKSPLGIPIPKAA